MGRVLFGVRVAVAEGAEEVRRGWLAAALVFVGVAGYVSGAVAAAVMVYMGWRRSVGRRRAYRGV